MPFDPPPNLTNADEYRHPKPKGAEDILYGDTLWVSVVDPAAGIHGVIHSHLTNNGYARFESLFVIDGVVQLYGNKIPLDPKPDNGPWSDGRLSYSVLEPWNHIKITFDWEAFAFDLDFKGRFAPFDYADCVPNGDPLARVGPFHGGHYEQAMNCTGSFEIRRGPERRRRPADRLLEPSRPQLVGSLRRPAEVEGPGGSFSPRTTGPRSSCPIVTSTSSAATSRTLWSPRTSPSAASSRTRTAPARC